jgi:Flp pilus assembly protein TadG
MVEFALVSPLLFLLVFGMVVTGIVVMNQIQLNNAVRDGARAAAVCGSTTPTSVTSPPGSTTRLPDGTTYCANSTITTYLTTLVNATHGGVAAPTFQVTDATGTPIGAVDDLSACAGHVGVYQVKIHATYSQPLYLPLVGQFFGSGGTSTRTLTADAEATCEQ